MNWGCLMVKGQAIAIGAIGVAVLAAALVACGGGGGGGASSSAATQNTQNMVWDEGNWDQAKWQ